MLLFALWLLRWHISYEYNSVSEVRKAICYLIIIPMTPDFLAGWWRRLYIRWVGLGNFIMLIDDKQAWLILCCCPTHLLVPSSSSFPGGVTMITEYCIAIAAVRTTRKQQAWKDVEEKEYHRSCSEEPQARLYFHAAECLLSSFMKGLVTLWIVEYHTVYSGLLAGWLAGHD